jgi:hypothetical protein
MLSRITRRIGEKTKSLDGENKSRWNQVRIQVVCPLWKGESFTKIVTDILHGPRRRTVDRRFCLPNGVTIVFPIYAQIRIAEEGREASPVG